MMKLSSSKFTMNNEANVNSINDIYSNYENYLL